MRLLSTVIVAALALAGGVAPAVAQSDYPTRQINFIVPFPLALSSRNCPL